MISAIAGKLPAPYRAPVLLSLACGLRLSEAAGLRRSEVESRADGLLLRLSPTRTKDAAERTVEVPDAMRPLLVAALAAPNVERVFPGARGGDLAFNLGQRFAKAAADAGFPAVEHPASSL